MKPNCYNCKFRRDVPGDAHSACAHPKAGGTDMIETIINIAIGNNSAVSALDIKGNLHGVKNGWFMWPANFDPVWLENCNGFEEKQNE